MNAPIAVGSAPIPESGGGFFTVELGSEPSSGDDRLRIGACAPVRSTKRKQKPVCAGSIDAEVSTGFPFTWYLTVESRRAGTSGTAGATIRARAPAARATSIRRGLAGRARRERGRIVRVGQAAHVAHCGAPSPPQPPFSPEIHRRERRPRVRLADRPNACGTNRWTSVTRFSPWTPSPKQARRADPREASAPQSVPQEFITRNAGVPRSRQGSGWWGSNATTTIACRAQIGIRSRASGTYSSPAEQPKSLWTLIMTIAGPLVERVDRGPPRGL